MFDSISSNIDKAILIKPPADVFVFRDFNVHHKNWLTYSGGTDRPGELSYNFSISNSLTQIVNLPIRIPDHHSPALLDLFVSSDISICTTMAFPPLRNSDHVVVSVSTDFPINSKQDMLLHCVASDYSCADWDGLRDHLKDVPWEDIFKLLLLLVNFMSGFRLELMYISLTISIRSNFIHLYGFQMLVLLP